MMDLKDAKDLARLIVQSEHVRDQKLMATHRREQAALGSMKANPGQDTACPANLPMRVFQLVVPQAVTSAPALEIRSNGGYEEQRIVAGYAAAASQMLRGQKAGNALRPAFWNYMFKGWCALFSEKGPAHMNDLTDAERDAIKARTHDHWAEDYGNERGDAASPRGTDAQMTQLPPRWSRLKNVPLECCGFDSEAGTVEEARFIWHDVTTDYDKLVKRAQESADWDAVAVANLKWDTTSENQPYARQVKYRQVYVPGAVIDDQPPKPNQHGVIRTIGMCRVTSDVTGVETVGYDLRKPYYWEGHPGGPITFIGQYATGVDAFFLGMFQAHDDALTMLESLTKAVRDRILEHTVKYGYDAARGDDAQELLDAPDGAFVAIPGLKDAGGIFERFEMSEVSPAEMAELREAQDEAGRALGDEAQQGRADPRATATAASISANTTANRLGYTIDVWNGGVGEAGERVVWDVAFDERMVVKLDQAGSTAVHMATMAPLIQPNGLNRAGAEAAAQLMSSEPVTVIGGDYRKEDNHFDWFGLDIRVVPYSMSGQQGEQQFQRYALWAQQIAALAPSIVQAPFFAWKPIITKMGRALGIEGADDMFDAQIAQQIAQIQMAQLSAPARASTMPSTAQSGATLREARGGAAAPAGVDPGTFQVGAA